MLIENIDPKAQKKHKGKAAPYGSGYDRVREAVAESLRDWFKKEDWVRINTSGNIAGKCGTMKKGKATTRCLPRKKHNHLQKRNVKQLLLKKYVEAKKVNNLLKTQKKLNLKRKNEKINHFIKFNITHLLCWI